MVQQIVYQFFDDVQNFFLMKIMLEYDHWAHPSGASSSHYPIMVTMHSKFVFVLLLKFSEGWTRGYVCEGVADYKCDETLF